MAKAKKKPKRVPTQVHTRKLDRNVARVQMKKLGIQHPNKRMRTRWREYVDTEQVQRRSIRRGFIWKRCMSS